MIKFSDLKLDPKVLTAISDAGYETPTPIQAGAIPPALEGRDVLGIAQTGTGKTASFTLPMITLLGRGRARARMPRSLVLCPTRELAAQVAENFDIYAKHTKLTKALLIGGVSFGEQDKLIDRGVDVLIATPGRLLDHFERGKLLLTGVQIMVVDEADRMLDMGFIPDIERIFQLTPFTRQTLFFSATMAPEIERITNTFLHAPERVEVARQSSASETITQRLLEITPTRRDLAAKQKRELLRAAIDAEGEKLTNAIIFCNRKTDVDIVAKSLSKYGYDAAAIHGDLEQSHRTRTLDSFREGKLKFLVASDVAARGLDIPAVSHVINFDLPSHAEDYVHRIGRTGRAGRLGTAISISTPSDEKYLTGIETLIKKALPRADLPEGFSPTETSKPRRDDDRKENRRGRNRRDDKRQQDKTEERQPEPKKVENKPARAEQRDDRKDDRRDNRRDDRKDDRRRGRGDDRGPAIVGMGDHIPGFMLVDLRPAVESAAENRDEQLAVKPEASEEAPPAKSKSRRRRKSAKNEHVAEAEAPAAEVIASEANPQDTAQDTPPAEEPAPAKPKRGRRKKTETTDEAAIAAPEEAPAEKPKPRRTRVRKPKAEAEPAAAEDGTTSTDAESAPAKPKRRSRAKPKADAEGTEEAPKKPARTRRKKVEQPEDTPPAPDQTPDQSGN